MTVYTIGVYGSDEESFFGALVEARIEVFCDIRLRRGVRGSQYAYVNSTRLQAKLKSLGISYVHLKELAPSAEVRSLQKAADTMQAESKRSRLSLSEAFVSAYSRQNLENWDVGEFVRQLGADRIALFCVEGEPGACHRSLVANRLNKALGTQVVHLQPTLKS